MIIDGAYIIVWASDGMPVYGINSKCLSNVDIIHETDPLSESFIVSTCDFTVTGDFVFEPKQKLFLYHNGEYIATFFVDKVKPTGRNTQRVETYDYIGLLNTMRFMSHMNLDVQNAKAAFEAQSSIFQIPIKLSSELENETYKGFTPICSTKEAWRKMCFAIGAYVDAFGFDGIQIKKFNSGETITADEDGVMSGITIEEPEKVSGVKITCTNYDSTTINQEHLWQLNPGEEMYAEFEEPSKFFVNNDMDNTDGLTQNVCWVRARNPYVHDGYEVSRRIYRSNTSTYEKMPEVSASEIEPAIKTISDITLAPVDRTRLLDDIYDYYTTRKKITLKTVETQRRAKYGCVKYGTFKYGELVNLFHSFKLGDRIVTKNEWGMEVSGRVRKQTYHLNGGIIVKENELV